MPFDFKLTPYKIKGKRYVPRIPRRGDVSHGTISWYGDPKGKSDTFHGRETACGLTFDTHQLLAAHRTFPMKTKVLVIPDRDENGKWPGLPTLVEIVDRGPFADSRIMDVSYAAAKRLGVLKPGTLTARLVVIELDPDAPKAI